MKKKIIFIIISLVILIELGVVIILLSSNNGIKFLHNNVPYTKDGYFNISQNGVLTLKDEYKPKGLFANELPKEISIPKKINGIKVKILADNSFANSNIEYIKIPNTVTEIKETAFDNCTVNEIEFSKGTSIKYLDLATAYCLTAVNIPDTVEILDISSELLKSLYIPKNIKSLGLYNCNIETLNIPKGIKDLFLSNCTKLQQLEIPDTVTSLHLYGCSSIETLDIPDSVTNFEGGFSSNENRNTGAFEYCTNLKEIKFSSSIQEIPEYTFRKCKNLETIVIPDSVISIGKYAFESSGLKEIYLPNSINKIGEYAFLYTSINKINIPTSLTVLEDFVFAYTNLETINIPNNITNIRSCAFSHTNISEIIFPESIKYYGDDIVCKCKNLKSITVLNPLPLTSKSSRATGVFDFTDIQEIKVPKDKLDTSNMVLEYFLIDYSGESRSKYSNCWSRYITNLKYINSYFKM